MRNDLLLNSPLAQKLYRECAENLPIIDYHNHLSLRDLSENKRFTDIYELWIAPDPYKHRAMRMMGIPEELITGKADSKEKFKVWCSIFPSLMGNPLYIWSLMELKTVFGIEEAPSEKNCEELYDKLNAFLQDNVVTPQYFVEKFNVELLCPCSSINDDFSVFAAIEKTVPSLRGDDMVVPNIEFINKLQAASGVEITDIEGFKAAIVQRLGFIKSVGLKYADHALDDGFIYYTDDGKNAERFQLVLSGEQLSGEEKQRLYSYILTFLAEEYAKQNIVLLLHIGAARYTSTRLRNKAGAAGGFAAIGNSVSVSSLTTMLDTVEKTKHGLPKIVLFTLNPADNALISILSGSFSKDNTRGLITQGPAWWWCDHKQGIEEMLEKTSVFGLLSNFIGMTTDARSLLSLVRHDYFRRIICNFVAQKVIDGEFPEDEDSLFGIISDLCYNNAKKITEG